jgi:hypothetical protein
MKGFENISDVRLIREILENEYESKRDWCRARKSVLDSGFKYSTKLEYLYFLQRAMDMGTKIDSDWSNFMFGDMFTIDRDFEYSGKTHGSSSLSFILKEGCELKSICKGGSELVYDMNLGVQRYVDGSWISDRVKVPRECLSSYSIMKKYGIRPNFIMSLIF